MEFFFRKLIWSVNFTPTPFDELEFDPERYTERNKFSNFFKWLSFLYPATQKVAGFHVIPPNFECPPVRPSSVRPSVSASFPCSNFRTVCHIFFRLCIDICIGEEWYGIASGLILFWNNRVMALDVCQKYFALRFRALTFVPFFTDFLHILHRHWYRRGVIWDCKWDNFIQKQQSYGPWFMSKMHFWSVS